jgi:hypothetical protein
MAQPVAQRILVVDDLQRLTALPTDLHKCLLCWWRMLARASG